MSKLIISGLLFFVSMLCGCESVRPVYPNTAMFDAPALNQVTEKELGDTLIDKGTIKSFEAIAITEPTVGHWGIGGKMTAEPGTFVAFGTTYFGVMYRAPAAIHWEAPIQSGLAPGGLIIPHSPTNQPCMFITVGAETRRSRPLKNLSFKKTTAEQILPGSFRQEFIYNGRSQNTLKFLYRELKDSYVRVPFSQEVTYDLKESDVIGFKGARLKVLDATNTKIRYQVTKSFD